MSQPAKQVPEADLAERVENDPKLNAAEKETTMSMYGNDKEFTVHSAKATVVKSLLKHDHFDPVEIRGLDGDEHARVGPSEADQLDTVYAVRGTLPVGCLTVKSKPRTNDHQSSIVNAETIDPDVFGDE